MNKGCTYRAQRTSGSKVLVGALITKYLSPVRPDKISVYPVAVESLTMLTAICTIA